MSRQDVLQRLLYPKCKSAVEFQFDSLIAKPLLYYLTPQDIMQLNKIATSLKLSSKPKVKYKMIDDIMVSRGFKKMASGTNRVVYRYLNDYSIVIKIAIDKVGLSDNGNEYINQHLLKPFVNKCFEVSPCGTVGLFERVIPITSREEFINLSEDIFDLINNLIGKYVLEDIGEKYYMNYGLREGFGPVLLDYPYVFELDGRKLICNVQDPLLPNGYCGGEIDYDIGYNDLICTKCGKRYLATELKTESKSDKPKIIIEGEDIIMKCIIVQGNEVVNKLNSEAPIATNTIKPRMEYSKLMARLTSEPVEQEAPVVVSLKTHDDVGLRCRVRGPRKDQDIDMKARIEEAERSMGNIEVDLNSIPSQTSTAVIDTNFKAEVVETVNEVITAEQVSESIKIIDECDNKPATIIEEPVAELAQELEKLDGVTPVEVEEVIEYVKEHEEESSKPIVIENPEPEEESRSGYSIGELLGDKLQNIVVNENYKTDNITSPIDSHFSAPKEAPTLIIHKRDEIDSEDKRLEQF